MEKLSLTLLFFGIHSTMHFLQELDWKLSNLSLIKSILEWSARDQMIREAIEFYETVSQIN